MRNEALSKFLEALAKHMNLSPAMEEKLLAASSLRHIKKNRSLPNFQNDYIFVVSGLFKMENYDTGDIMLFLFEEHFALFPQAEDTFHYISLEESTVLIVSRDCVMDIVSKDKVIFTAYQKIVHRWAARQCERQELLLLPASERKAELLRRFGNVANRIQNRDLATYLCMGPSYYSSL